MTYQDALTYLDSLINHEKISGFDYKKSFKLERMKSFSRIFGDPQKGIRAIHIGGTKGKGSVASFINSILMEAGYKVALYTSPHLFSFRERVRINGEAIGEKNVAELIGEIKPHIEAMKKEGNSPTYFEVCTMMAFLYFKRENARFMVLEVGMGGRLDSTNITEPLVSVIAPISYDHTQYLGATLSDIAFEKCGIIKQDSIVISSPQDPEAMDVIERISKERNSRLYVVGRDIFFETLDSDMDGENFRLITRCCEYPHLRVCLLGDFQVENAAGAVMAVEALRARDIFIDAEVIKSGLGKARWPGRFEIIDKKPFIVVDGAQDVNSVLRLKKALKNKFSYKKLILVIGAMQDKDIDGMCREFGDIADYVITTKAKTERACPPRTIQEKVLYYNSNIGVVATDSVEEAVKKSRAQAGKDDLILITGSLYIVAEAMKGLYAEKF